MPQVLFKKFKPINTYNLGCEAYGFIFNVGMIRKRKKIKTLPQTINRMTLRTIFNIIRLTFLGITFQLFLCMP